MTRDGWWWVSFERATIGFSVKDGRVAETAPIARWAHGKRWVKVCRYYRRRGAQVKKLTWRDVPFYVQAP